MNKSLGSIAATGIVLSVIFFVLAGMLPRGGLWGIAPNGSRPGSNQWAWDGGDRLEIDLPAEVKLTPGGPPTVIVHGDESDLKDIRVSHGQLTGGDGDDCVLWFLCGGNHRNRPIEVELRGVSLSDIRINGVAKVDMGHLDQENLTLRISGAGEVEGEGQVKNLDLSVSGAGNVEFAKLAVANAKVNLSGAGKAAIAPSEEADINISGVGQVELASKPKSLTSHISGMGNISGPGAEGQSGRNSDWNENRHHDGHDLSKQIRDQIRAEMKERRNQIKAEAKERAKQGNWPHTIGAQIEEQIRDQRIGQRIEDQLREQGL
jgi:hypothetical protein